MVGEPEGPIGLPQAPPPRPAARQRAIDAAMRKFDGLEPAAPNRDGSRQPTRIGWVMRHQRAAGALATAVLVLSLSVPIGLRIIDQGRPSEASPEVKSSARPNAELAERSPEAPPRIVAPSSPALGEQTPHAQSEVKTAAPRPLPNPLSRNVAAADVGEEVAGQGTSSALTAPPPPPPAPAPPPPPPPTASVRMAENDAAFADKTGVGEVVVTGSRIRRPGAERVEIQCSLSAVSDAQECFVAELQEALRSRDRERVIQLVRLPLRVRYIGGAVIYRRAADVRRDFDRIFTPAVESSLLQGRNAPDDLRPGQASSVGRIRLSQGCSNARCKPTSSWRVISVAPD